MSNPSEGLPPIVGCYGNEEHDVELYETNRKESVYQCMICGLEMRYPRDLKPEDAS